MHTYVCMYIGIVRLMSSQTRLPYVYVYIERALPTNTNSAKA
jgi:hypothetical protein